MSAEAKLRMLLADRVKPDLIAAVRATRHTGDVARALALLRRWDNTAAPASRGAMLFEIWYQRYAQGRQPAETFAREWTVGDPLRTPRGLADRKRAADAFAWAVEETARRHGRWDVAWGDVHRVRRGSVTAGRRVTRVHGVLPLLGFTRDAAASFRPARRAWVLAVEFANNPARVFGHGLWQSPHADSPWPRDQAAMFARGEMKKVAFTRATIERQAVTRYRRASDKSVNSGVSDIAALCEQQSPVGAPRQRQVPRSSSRSRPSIRRAIYGSGVPTAGAPNDSSADARRALRPSQVANVVVHTD